MTTTIFNDKDALSALPSTIRADVMKTAAAVGRRPDELTDVRLRREGESYISFGRDSYKLLCKMTPRRFDDIVFAMTNGSLYAHAETIRDGYINAGGVRCGVCGRANLEDGKIREICDVSSLSLRVRRDVVGASEVVFDILSRGGFANGVLIYSRPGVGKTTLLRDLIRNLSAAGRQFAVVDCRGELGDACVGTSADVLSGYPKSDGIRAAVRSLCPELIICDELSGSDDADAALFSRSCGVPIVATAHASSVEELRMRPESAALFENRVFSYFVGLHRDKDGVRQIVTEP